MVPFCGTYDFSDLLFLLLVGEIFFKLYCDRLKLILYLSTGLNACGDNNYVSFLFLIIPIV